MALEEDAVRQALGMLTQGISPGAQSLLSDQVAGGTLGERRIGGATSYFDPVSRLPLGAVDDPRSPMGFTIADPNLRNMYSNEMGGTAAAVSQNEYMDAFERDKLKNTLAIMAASDKMDPDIQMAVMQRLGIQTPGFGDQGGGGQQGIPTFAGNYLGARQTATGAEPIWGSGGGAGDGYMSRKLHEELAKLKYAHELGADERDKADILRNIQAMTALTAAQSNATYKQAMEGAKQTTNAQALLGLLDNFTKQHQVAAQPGPLGNPQDAAALAQAIEFIRSQIGQMGGGTGAGAMQGGGIMTGRAAGNPAAMDLGNLANPNRTPTLAELNPPGEQQTPWWDRGMPSTQQYRPDPAKLAELQRRLVYARQAGDKNLEAAMYKQIQQMLVPPLQNTQTPAASNEGITVKKK